VRKRVFDVVFALASVVLLAPVFLIAALAILLYDGGPVFYRGERIGLDGEPFRIVKFRTMVVDAERIGASSTADDDPRVTPVGRLLRRSKVDELPQLFNVLAGDMSVVGPRPQVRWAVERYQQEERALLSVRPGITDFASLRFRNEGEILRGSTDPDRDYLEKIAPEKMRLALHYVRHRSLSLDLQIVLATVLSIFGVKPESIMELPGATGRTGMAA